MFHYFNIDIDPNGKGHPHGIDMGPIQLHAKKGNTLILKKPGHNYYGGHRQPSVYSPARFLVYDIVAETPSTKQPGWIEYELEEIVQFDIR